MKCRQARAAPRRSARGRAFGSGSVSFGIRAGEKKDLDSIPSKVNASGVG